MNKLKIEQLLEGLVVDRAWLKSKGINASLVDYYMRSGYLVSVAHGAYRRPGAPLKWEHLVYSLQYLGFKVHVGGRSALELKGLAHYLPLNQKQRINLFCDERLPSWLARTDVPVEFVEHKKVLFSRGEEEKGLTTILFGGWDWKINVASPERALMEMMADLPRKVSFPGVDAIMESVSTLRKDVVEDLLRDCQSVKVKRLFLWFAEKHRHLWFDQLQLDGVDMGKGKRVIEKAGRFDPKYLITVPNTGYDQQRQPLF